MVQKEDAFSGGDDFDRLRRLEAIVATLAVELLNTERPRRDGGRLRRFLYRLSRDPSYNVEETLQEVARLLADPRPFRFADERRWEWDQLARARSSLAELKHSEVSMRKELHTLTYRLHAGLDLERIKDTKYIPIRVYTSENDPDSIRSIEHALEHLLKEFSIEISDQFSPIRGSWFKRFIGKTKKAATSDEVQEILRKVQHGIELEALHKKQADVNKTQAEALREVMSAMDCADNAACTIGSLLIIKLTKEGVTNVATKTLTQNEMIAIEDNQTMLMNPTTLLENLAATSRNNSRVPPMLEE